MDEIKLLQALEDSKIFDALGFEVATPAICWELRINDLWSIEIKYLDKDGEEVWLSDKDIGPMTYEIRFYANGNLFRIEYAENLKKCFNLMGEVLING